MERVGVNLSLVDPSSKRKKIVYLNRCKITPRNGDENLTVNSEDIERVDWQNRGNDSRVDNDFEGEGEMSCSYESQ